MGLHTDMPYQPVAFWCSMQACLNDLSDFLCAVEKPNHFPETDLQNTVFKSALSKQLAPPISTCFGLLQH